MSAPKFAVIFKSEIFDTQDDVMKHIEEFTDEDLAFGIYLAEITSLKLLKMTKKIELEEV